jgi:ABC-type glycerol-3-phosphate transport system substrate-binding protein
MWHNLDLYDQEKKADDPENLQKLALDGFWTYSELYRWSSYVEKSGENVCDYLYGVEINTSKANGIPYDAVPAAFDVDYLITNADGTHKYNVVGNEKLEAALNDWRKIMNGEGNTSSQSVVNACSCKFHTKSHFVDGKVLFTADILYRSKEYNLAMREMDDAYAILPMPKYNEEQTNYGTTPADSYTLLAVIDHSASTLPTKGEPVSAYLQYATEYSYLNVRQYYFYEVVETRYFGTDDSDGHVSDSISIFHEILDHIELTFAYVYSPMLNNYTWLWRDTLNGTNGDNTMASYYDANKDAFEDAVYDLDKWLGLVN